MQPRTAIKIVPQTGTDQHLADWPAAPYLGLNFYTAAEAPLFGERSQEIEDCAALISEFSTRMLLLHGRSGIGKSSFLRAGLIPRLEKEGSPFCFLRLDPENREPAFIRCTDDPVSRIHHVLKQALKVDPQLRSIALGYRQRAEEILDADLTEERNDTANSILRTLAVLSAGLAQTMVLVIDQSEEILTLQASKDSGNRRKAFFYLLEELCLQNLDIRIIVALRTEYYGHFCNSFRISPSLRVTSTVRAGLEQFMLQGLSKESIVGAILRPTLTTAIEGYGIPRQKYHFEYGHGVAQHIAQDLLDHCGESSTLPVLQIVCKDLYDKVVIGERCPVITLEHYKRLEGVKGRIDAFINEALRGVLRNNGRGAVGSVAIMGWRRVLATLVARQEGNSVTTLIRAEQELVDCAEEQDLGGNIREVLAALASDKWRLLRFVGGDSDPNERQYSLGHDAIAVALFQWSEAQEKVDRLERKSRKQTRQLKVYCSTFFGVLLFVLISIGWQNYRQAAESNAKLIQYSKEDKSPDFRLRIQLLLASLSISEGPWSLFISSMESRNELARVLSSSPVLAEDAVGFDEANTRMALLSGNSVTVVDLTSGEEKSRYTLQDLEPLDGFPATSAIGFMTGLPQPVVYKNGYLHYWVASKAMAVPLNDFLTDEFKGAPTLPYSSVDFVAGFAQIALSNRTIDSDRWIKVLRLTALAPNRASPFVTAKASSTISWAGSSQLPVISFQSDKVSYIGRTRKEEIYSSVMLTSINNPANVSFVVGLSGAGSSESDFPISLAFSDEGNSLIVRDSPDALTLIPIAQIGRHHSADKAVSVVRIPDGWQDGIRPRRPMARPLLAAVQIESEWRFAWPTPGGIVGLKSQLGSATVATPLVILPFLTGSIRLDEASRLSFSRNGRLLMLSRRSRQEPTRYLVWDLSKTVEQFAQLPTQELRRIACRTAALDGPLPLTKVEKLTWIGESARQPCAGFGAEEY